MPATTSPPTTTSNVAEITTTITPTTTNIPTTTTNIPTTTTNTPTTTTNSPTTTNTPTTTTNTPTTPTNIPTTPINIPTTTTTIIPISTNFKTTTNTSNATQGQPLWIYIAAAISGMIILVIMSAILAWALKGKQSILKTVRWCSNDSDKRSTPVEIAENDHQVSNSVDLNADSETIKTNINSAGSQRVSVNSITVISGEKIRSGTAIVSMKKATVLSRIPPLKTKVSTPNEKMKVISKLGEKNTSQVTSKSNSRWANVVKTAQNSGAIKTKKMEKTNLDSKWNKITLSKTGEKDYSGIKSRLFDFQKKIDFD